MTTKTTRLTLSLLALAGPAAAQGIDVSAEASHSLRPQVALDGASGVDVGSNAVQVGFAVRASLSPRTFLTSGVSYRGEYFDYSGAAPEPSTALHRVEVPSFLLHILDERWALVGMFAPGLSGNFDGLDRHFRFNVVAGAAYAFRRDLVLGFGAMLDYSAGRWLPIPVVTLDWQIADGLFLKALGPVTRFFYRWGDRLEVGTFLQLDVDRWAIAGAAEERTIDYYSVDVGAQAAVRLGGTTWLSVAAGWSPYRRYDVDGGPNDGRYDPKPGALIRTGLEIRLPGR